MLEKLKRITIGKSGIFFIDAVTVRKSEGLITEADNRKVDVFEQTIVFRF